MITVLKDFKTPIRSFAVGENISLEDIDGPVAADRWQELGFIAVDADPEPEPPPQQPAE